MSRREFHFEEGSSRKFWAVTIAGTSLNIQFGKIGTSGQTQVKQFPTEDEARRAADKLVAEKTRKGYVEVAGQPSEPSEPSPAPARKSKKGSPEPAPTSAATAPPAPAVTRSIALPLAEFRRVPWSQSPDPPAPKAVARPFDFAACVTQLQKVHERAGARWNRREIALPEVATGEEARFWFHIYVNLPVDSKRDRQAFLDGLTPEVCRDPIPFSQLQDAFREERYTLEWTSVFQLQISWLTPGQVLDLTPGVPWGGGQVLLNWLQSAVFPHLAPGERKQWVAALRERLPRGELPASEVAAYCAIALGVQDALCSLVERLPDGAWGGKNATNYPEILFGLQDSELIARHGRRLGIRLWDVKLAQVWLAWTEYRGLEVLAGAVPIAFSPGVGLDILNVLCTVDAPEVAPLLLDVKLGSKTAKQVAAAHAWLEAHPGNAIAGLLPLAAEKGKRGEAVLQYLREAKQRGLGPFIAEQLPGVPSEVTTKVRAEVLEKEEVQIELLEESATPAGLRKALAASPAGSFRPPAFVSLGSLPSVLVGGKRLGEGQVLAVLAAMAGSTLEAPAPLLEALREHADRGPLADFAWGVFEMWLGAGAPWKERWPLLALGHLGTDATVLRLTPLIRAWPGESQHQRAVLGLDVLRTIGTDGALIALNGMALKLKFKGLQERARQMMEAIAADRGLTRDQLEDRIVPDFDFDARGGRVFDFGPRRFQFVFAPDLTPMVRDDAGKVAKDLPTPGTREGEKANEAVADWKVLKKQARETAGVQAFRLEQAMITGRRWTPEEFETLLVRHPFMTHLARRLLWGGYDAKGKLVCLLRVTEDQTYADADDKPYDLKGLSALGIVHPLHLNAEQRRKWGVVFGDYEIISPFPQLDRTTHTPDPKQLQGNVLKPFETKVPAMTVRGTLEKLGWQRKLTDHGAICGFNKPFPFAGVIGIVVIDPGIILSYDADEDQTVEAVFFVAGADGKPAGGVYPYEARPVKKGNTQVYEFPAIPFTKVDAVAQSEMIRDVLEIVDRR
jgi:predicted DNA-binding WGR domain protein